MILTEQETSILCVCGEPHLYIFYLEMALKTLADALTLEKTTLLKFCTFSYG